MPQHTGWQLQRLPAICVQHNRSGKRRSRQLATAPRDVPEFHFLRIHLGQLVRFELGIQFTTVRGLVVWSARNPLVEGGELWSEICKERLQGRSATVDPEKDSEKNRTG